MTTEHLPGADGSSTPPRWSARTAFAAVGIATVIAAFGGAAVYAATGHTQHIGGGFGPGFGAGGPGGPGPGGPGLGGPGSGRPANPQAAAGPVGSNGPALHGTFVVAADPNGAGGFVTVLAQTGTVTAASPTALTVRSDDGFTQTYATTRGEPVMRVDEVVTVRATQPAAGGPAALPTVTELLEPPPRTATP